MYRRLDGFRKQVSKMEKQSINNFIPNLSKLSMTDECFARLSTFIQGNYGIKMPDIKKGMLESRLQKRLRMLGMHSFEEYGEYLFSPEGQKNEIVNMLNQVTTNKTDFFREPDHFEYLFNNYLPELLTNTVIGTRRPLEIWSAGCSSGEEPYTIAMVMAEFAALHDGFDYKILGTDISMQVLKAAVKGIYKEHLADPIPERFKKRYLLRSRDREKALVRIVPKLRQKVRFQYMNFMNRELKVDRTMDVIFCRNVIIYFERAVQQELIRKLCDNLAVGGLLLLGHSETLHGMSFPLVPIAPMVYRKLS